MFHSSTNFAHFVCYTRVISFEEGGETMLTKEKKFVSLENDWLFNSATQFTLTPCLAYSSSVFYVESDGHGEYYNLNADNYYGVRPSLYLKSSVKINSDEISDGSSTNPYVLIP